MASIRTNRHPLMIEAVAVTLCALLAVCLTHESIEMNHANRNNAFAYWASPSCPYSNSAASASVSCARAAWPLRKPTGKELKTIERKPQIPQENWKPGHRGLDIASSPDARIFAPSDGTILFAGKVGGKDTLSVQLQSGVIMTFEPAQTKISKGTMVHQGEEIGIAEGHSDHCDARCVHIGAKRNGSYIDPRLILFWRRIILKPHPY